MQIIRKGMFVLPFPGNGLVVLNKDVCIDKAKTRSTTSGIYIYFDKPINGYKGFWIRKIFIETV